MKLPILKISDTTGERKYIPIDYVETALKGLLITALTVKELKTADAIETLLEEIK